MKKIENAEQKERIQKHAEVEIKRLNREEIDVSIKGVTPLLMEKMDASVVDKYDKKKGKRIIKTDDRMEAEKTDDKIYHTEDGNIGFPVAAFAKGMVEVAPYVDLDKKRVRGSVRILGNITPIEFKDKTLNTAVGKTSGMTKAPRKIIRPEFHGWSCALKILFNANEISAEQIVNLLNHAGFHMGIGGWRPEHGGTYGQYEVSSA